MQRNNIPSESLLASFKSCAVCGLVFSAEPMTRHTSFEIGGPADFMVLPANVVETESVIKLAMEKSLPITVIGKGSNLLVRDKGIRGLVLKVGEPMSKVQCEGDVIIAGAGAALSDVSKLAAAADLTGLEFAVGIPGSLGGAVYMNAGAYDGEISRVVESVTAVCPAGKIQYFSKSELDFGYRHSVFQDNNCIICEVRLKLQKGDQAKISSTMQELTQKRESRQPLEWPSAGSTFRRPPGFFAGTLVEAAGCKGLSCGGAKVSDKHAGFIINTGGASAEDVLSLIRKIQCRVKETSGVELCPEVIVLGEE